MARANDADIATQALNTLQGTGAIFFNLLALMVIAVVMMAVVLFTLERTSPGSRPVIRKGCCTGLKDSGVLIMLLLAGVDIRLPSGRCSRPAGAMCSMCSGLLAIMVTAMSTVVLQSASNTFSIQSFADLSGKTVIAVGGTTGEQYVNANGINVETSPVATVDDMFARFENGEGDALFYDKPILSAFIARDTAAMGSERFALRGQIHLQQQYGIAMAPTLSAEAKEAVDRAILSFYGSDEFRVLQARWLGVSLESSVEQSTDPTTITRFLEDYFWLIAIGGGIIIGLALLVGLVGLGVRYQMSQAGDDEAKKRSVVLRLFGCCFGKDHQRGQATDKIAALKRARRSSVAGRSQSAHGSTSRGLSGTRHSTSGSVSLPVVDGSGEVRLATSPQLADPSSSCSCCACFGGSDARSRRLSTRVTPTSGPGRNGGGGGGGRDHPPAPQGLSEELALRDAKSGSRQWEGISPASRSKLAWSKEEGVTPAHSASAHLSDILGVVPGGTAADREAHDVTGVSDDDLPATGLTSSPRLLTGKSGSEPHGWSLSAGRMGPGSHKSADDSDQDSEPLLDRQAGAEPFVFGDGASKSESGGPSASDAVARAFGGIAGGVFSKGGNASTAGGSSVQPYSGDHFTTPVTGTPGAGFGGHAASGGSALPPPLMTRLETAPSPITRGLEQAETPRTLKVHQAQAAQAMEAHKTLSSTASGVEAALANMSFRLPKPGEQASGPHGRLAATGGGGPGGLGLPAGASLEMDADERLFLKREQWRLRYASRLAPILPPNDLIWVRQEALLRVCLLHVCLLHVCLLHVCLLHVCLLHVCLLHVCLLLVCLLHVAALYMLAGVSFTASVCVFPVCATSQMIYERVDILTQQALLQRAMGRLDVPADLEEISPKDLSADAEEIRVFLVSKGVAPRSASSLAVLVAMGGTMNDHDAENDEASLTTVRQNHRVLGGAGADTIVAADKSSKAVTRREVKSKAGTTALRKMQLRARMASALVSHPSRANVLGKPPQLKTAATAKQTHVPPMGHRSSSVGPVPKRSGSRSGLVGSGGRVARVGRSKTRRPREEAEAAAPSEADAGATRKPARSRSRKQRGEKRPGKQSRSKPRPDAAKP
jgi:hypothetical protein